MAFPTIQAADTKTGSVTSNSTSWTLTYPTNLAAGDLILAIVGSDGNQTAGAGPSFPSWGAQGAQVDGSAASSLCMGAKIASGSETGNFTLTMPANEQGPWTVLRITGWYGSGLPAWTATALGNAGSPLTADGLEAGTSTIVGTSTTANPPDLNPGNWGTEDTLWLAVAAWDSTPTATAKDANFTYTTSQPMSSGGAGGAGLAVSFRQLNAANLDPGAYTLSAAESGVIATLGIRPAAAAAFQPRPSGVDFADPAVL